MIPGKSINLWALEKGDLVQNYLWGNDPEIVKLTGMNPAPKTAWEVERWYDQMVSDPNLVTLAIKLNDGTYVGNVEISSIDWRSRKGEIGVMIGNRSYRRQGYAREAILMMCRHAFEEMGFHRIYAHVLPFNQKAHKLFEACGFTDEGEMREAFFTWGRWWNVSVMSILAEEFFEKFPEEYTGENPEQADKQGEIPPGDENPKKED